MRWLSHTRASVVSIYALCGASTNTGGVVRLGASIVRLAVGQCRMSLRHMLLLRGMRAVSRLVGVPDVSKPRSRVRGRMPLLVCRLCVLPRYIPRRSWVSIAGQ